MLACRRQASKNNNFVVKLKRSDEARIIFYKFLCLPLLPSEKILEGFEIVCNEANENYDKLFEKFIKYFKRQWIEKVCLYSI